MYTKMFSNKDLTRALFEVKLHDFAYCFAYSYCYWLLSLIEFYKTYLVVIFWWLVEDYVRGVKILDKEKFSAVSIKNYYIDLGF